MGFTINGFGTGDKYHLIKKLGIHHCPNCGHDSQFELGENRKSIKLLYISTVTIQSKYGIFCSSCEHGKFVGDDVRMGLMSGQLEFCIENKEFRYIQTNTRYNIQQPTKPQQATIQQSQPETQNKTFCMYCGTEQISTYKFCSNCGKPKAQTTEAPTPVTPPAENVCPSCGKKNESKGKFCLFCGHHFAETNVVSEQSNQVPTQNTPTSNITQIYQPKETPVINPTPNAQSFSTQPKHEREMTSGDKKMTDMLSRLQDSLKKSPTQFASNESSQKSAIKTCSNCGDAISSGMLFCGKCGTRAL